MKRVDESDEEYRVRHAAEMQAWREKHPETARLIHRRYYEKNAETVKAKARADRAANLEKERLKSARARARRTPEQIEAQKQRCRDWYARNKESIKASNSAWAKANREKVRGYYRAWEARNPRHTMVQRAKHTAKQRGLEFTITVADLEWPTHCPILGIELQYDRDKKSPHRSDYPTLDRRDNSKGYVPGNVFVISWLANRMKWHSKPEQLRAILAYMEPAG